MPLIVVVVVIVLVYAFLVDRAAAGGWAASGLRLRAPRHVR